MTDTSNFLRLRDAKRKRLGRLLAVSCSIAVSFSGCDQSATPSLKKPAPSPSSTSEAKDTLPIERPRQELLDAAEQFHQAGELELAQRPLRELLLRDQHDVEAIFGLAMLESEMGRIREAISLLGEIPAKANQEGIAALGMSAEWLVQIRQYDEAKQRYRKILDLLPQANEARRPLAYLNNRQGRRHTAIKLVRELCIDGDITQDELHSMIAEADAMYDPPPSQSLSSIANDAGRPYYPISPFAFARFEFTNHRYAEAAALVRPLVSSGLADDAILAFYGRAGCRRRKKIPRLQNGWQSPVMVLKPIPTIGPQSVQS